jgi:germination protein M
MRRILYFSIAVIIMALILTGCKIPFIGESVGSPDMAKDGDMVRLDDGKDASGTGAAGADSTAGTLDGNRGWAGDTVNDPANDPAGGDPADQPDHGRAAAGNGDIAGIGGGDAEPAGSEYSDDGTGIAGSIRQEEGPLPEDASSSTEEYDPEQDAEGSALPATGVLAAVAGRTVSTFAEPRRPVTVYYQDRDGCVVPMTRWIQPQLGIARAAVSLAIDSPLTREETAYYGVYPTLPENTVILGIDIRDGIATIDFNRYLLSYGTAYSERNIVASIVYTLTEFDTIQKVRIMINGYPQGILKYGTDLSYPLGREDIMINTGPRLLTSGKEKIDIYLMKTANEGFAYPVPVSVASSGDGTGVKPETLVKQLLSAAPEGGMYSEMPEGVSLITSYVQDDTVTLDFSKEFIGYTGAAREESILKQLAYTLRQCEGIRKINILVEGRKAELPGGTNISAGLAIPVTVNDVMDR